MNYFCDMSEFGYFITITRSNVISYPLRFSHKYHVWYNDSTSYYRRHFSLWFWFFIKTLQLSLSIRLRGYWWRRVVCWAEKRRPSSCWCTIRRSGWNPLPSPPLEYPQRRSFNSQNFPSLKTWNLFFGLFINILQPFIICGGLLSSVDKKGASCLVFNIGNWYLIFWQFGAFFSVLLSSF